MRCKSCYRDCPPPRFVAEFGMLITPTYCNEQHGGMNHTLQDLRAQAEGDEQKKPAHLNVSGGLGRERKETPEQREKRIAADRKKQDDKKAARKKLRGPKKQKGDKKNRKKGGGKDGGGKGKKNKPDKNARKAARHGGATAPTANPPATPGKETFAEVLKTAEVVHLTQTFKPAAPGVVSTTNPPTTKE